MQKLPTCLQRPKPLQGIWVPLPTNLLTSTRTVQTKMQAKKTSSKKGKITSENEIIQSEKVGGCIEILKSGTRKGNPCGCKVKENGFCGRHLNN